MNLSKGTSELRKGTDRRSIRMDEVELRIREKEILATHYKGATARIAHNGWVRDVNLKLQGRTERPCLLFTDVVKSGERGGRQMKRKQKGGKKTVKIQGTPAVRATISFPPDMYETLEMVAKQKKVSLAWVVREASEKYIAEKWPLFESKK